MAVWPLELEVDTQRGLRSNLVVFLSPISCEWPGVRADKSIDNTAPA